MKVIQNKFDGIKYKAEHLICENYISDERAIWEVIELSKNQMILKEALERSTLLFVLTGKLEIATDSVLKQKVEASKMFLIPIGGNFYGHVLEDTIMLRCSFTRNIALCNKFSIEQLQNYIQPNANMNSSIASLPIHPLLLKELEATRDILNIGLSCIHYQRIKMDMIFIELRGLYCREDLAAMFAPMLGKDDDFKSKVMQVYSHVNTVSELSKVLNMSPSCFKRKFYDSFGTSAKQWMIQKKKVKLLRDIIMSKMSIAELAEKYNFTANYLTSFCKEHFGKAPTELRAECLNEIKRNADKDSSL